MPDLTGLWQCDDGGTYVLRQIGDVIWWLGLSKDHSAHPVLDSGDGIFYPGLRFCNVFRGQVQGNRVYGPWSDVPRGKTDNRGDLSLQLVLGLQGQQQLILNGQTGDFGGTSWERVLAKPIPRSAGELFGHTYKCVKDVGKNQENLADNLELIIDSAALVGVVTRDGTEQQRQQAASVNYPLNRGRDYQSFICSGGGGEEDGDVTFFVLVDQRGLDAWERRYLKGVPDPIKREVMAKLRNGAVEAEIIMYGRSPDCEHVRTDTPALFPGWAESGGSSVLFNGRPIPIVILPPGVGSNQPNFLGSVTFNDFVRVVGALVFDVGHAERGLEIHPVYSIDHISSALPRNLSGVWGDDFGSSYFLRHDELDNSVWYAGISPLGRYSFGQVFHGTYDSDASALSGEIVALSFGLDYPVTASGFSSTFLGDTGRITFEREVGQLLGRPIDQLSVGSVRLLKLYDV
jgi:hypothetical protein